MEEPYKPPSSRIPLSERREFDVFLSFRGPDVRKTFVDHLYRSLSTAGLNVFLDSEKLEKGENIGRSLQQAIQNSSIFIPIFSPDYATSVWCLKEVSLMWNLFKSAKTRIVIPLFYNVEPSHVRYAGGPYGEAFTKHAEDKRHGPDVIQRWRDVLREVSCLSGWSLEETASGYEGKLVSQVVKDVLLSFDMGMQEVAHHSVGLEPRCVEVRELLKLEDETCDKLTLGIWGMPGLGKTNLAKALYNQIRGRFDVSSFVSNVKCEGSLNGRITKLQGQILKDLSGIDMKVNNVGHGKIVMRSRLASKPALVVLDGVENEWQLDALQGDGFGKGSRIIITTRDKGLLKKDDVIYSMRKLEHNEAVELFSRHAFHIPKPKSGYEDATERIVKHCSGLPLSLEIIGRDLQNKDDNRYWSGVLNTLENVGQCDRVFKTLKLSYDSLSPEEKHIFLDIACFFVDIKRSNFKQNRAFSVDFYCRFWSTFVWHSVFKSVEKLKEKSFILVDEQKYSEDMDDCLGDGQRFWEFAMHDEIRDMGRRIVLEESRSDPAKRSRIWQEEDIRTLMAATAIKKGNANAKGLVWRSRMELQSIERLASLQKLGFLMWWELQVETEINKLPTNLKYLVLSECRLEMTRTERGKKRKLDYNRSSNSQTKMTGNSSDRDVHELPVFAHVLPKSIAQLVYLKYLDMSGTKQSCLPAEICNLHSLEEVYLSRCGLTALPHSLGSLINLRSLDVSDNFLLQFPPTFDSLVCLVNLEMARNKQLVVFPPLPVNLTVLNARECSKLQSISLNKRLGSLKTVDLSHCKELHKLDPLLLCVASLRTTGCSKLDPFLPRDFPCSLKYSARPDRSPSEKDLGKYFQCSDLGMDFVGGMGFPCSLSFSPHPRPRPVPSFQEFGKTSKAKQDKLKELHMIGCGNTGLNMFKLLKDFPDLEQLQLSLSSEVVDEPQPLIGEKNLTLHSLSCDTCLAAFFCFVTEGVENVRLPQMEVLMTYLDDVSGSLISKNFEVPGSMKGDTTERVIMRVCIWQIKMDGLAMKRGIASCSYSVRHPLSKRGSEVFPGQVEFLNLKEEFSIQFLEQWKLLSSQRYIHYN